MKRSLITVALRDVFRVRYKIVMHSNFYVSFIGKNVIRGMKLGLFPVFLKSSPLNSRNIPSVRLNLGVHLKIIAFRWRLKNPSQSCAKLLWQTFSDTTFYLLRKMSFQILILSQACPITGISRTRISSAAECSQFSRIFRSCHLGEKLNNFVILRWKWRETRMNTYTIRKITRTKNAIYPIDAVWANISVYEILW